MGCTASTGSSNGCADSPEVQSKDDHGDEQQREQARLLEELDRLKPPNSSQGDVCREPIVGRAVIATFLAEGSCTSTFESFYGQEHPRPAPAPNDAALSESSREGIHEYLRRVEVPSQPAADSALVDVKCDWEPAALSSPTHAPTRHLSGTLGTDTAVHSVAEIGFFPVTPE